MSEIKRLTWSEAEYTTKNGKAGGLRLFVITWRSRREDRNWVMRTDLPGHAGREWRDDDDAVLREEAESLLADWLAKVNGSPL